MAPLPGTTPRRRSLASKISNERRVPEEGNPDCSTGALRISVQTESGNAAALMLYRTSGFVPVEGLQGLVLPLHHGDT